MRLIEKSFQLSLNDLKLNWKEIEGSKSNLLILETYKSVDDLDCPERYRDDSEIPWCACYINKKIQDAGGRGTRSCVARSFLHWGNKSNGKIGDIVIFERGNNGYSGHVAFIYEIKETSIICLGGNQQDNVCLHEYDKSKVLGFRTSKD